jgi:hypothetical protein
VPAGQRFCGFCCRCAEAATLKRQLADAHSADSGDLQRRLKDVTDMLYLKQTQVGRPLQCSKYLEVFIGF